jgi:hypothetical protein
LGKCESKNEKRRFFVGKKEHKKFEEGEMR